MVDRSLQGGFALQSWNRATSEELRAQLCKNPSSSLKRVVSGLLYRFFFPPRLPGFTEQDRKKKR